MSSKVESHGNIAFSWEKKPGVSKVARQDHHAPWELPPPPARLLVPDLRVPARSSSRKETDDPFLIAYKEVTKSSRKGKSLGYGGVMKKKKNTSFFSCKSCSVNEDSVVRLPISRSFRDEALNYTE